MQGTLPITVTVNGASATVNTRSYNLFLALAEGDQALSVWRKIREPITRPKPRHQKNKRTFQE
jgi:hypothetical protein